MYATKEFVRSIVTHPDIWPTLAEDSDSPDMFEPSDARYFQHEDFGYIEFRMAGHHWAQVHIAMLRGAVGVAQFVKESMQEMRSDGVKRFTAMIPKTNRSAILLAYRTGFHHLGRIDGALLKGGKMIDLEIMGAE